MIYWCSFPQEETTVHGPWLLKYGKVYARYERTYHKIQICLSSEATINKQPACDYPLFIGKRGHEFWGPLAHLLVLPREALLQFQNRRNPLKNVGKKRRGLLSTQNQLNKARNMPGHPQIFKENTHEYICESKRCSKTPTGWFTVYM